MIGTRDGFVGGDLQLGLQRGQCLGEAFEILDAQLRTDVEVLGEMSGAVLQSPPAADDHVVDAVLIERVDRLQRLEHAAASSRRGRQPTFGADASLLAVDERPQFCRRRWPLHPHQDRAVISAACGRSALDATALLGRERRVVHEPQFTASIVCDPSLLATLSTRRTILRRSRRLLPNSANQEATGDLRCPLVLAESESGSTATRPAWATNGQSQAHPIGCLWSVIATAGRVRGTASRSLAR